MTTFLELVNQVHSMLHSYTGVQEQVTSLTSSIDSDDTSLALADTSGISRGILEIDSELLYADSTDSTSAAVPAFGRGFRGTTAAAHTSGAMVVYDPAFPKFEIKRAINQCVEALYPQLYQIKSTTLTFVGAQLTYELPADCDAVVKVTWESVGPSQYWYTVASWEFDTNSTEATGNTLTFHEDIMPGRTVKVVYQAKPAQFSLDADTFATKGIEESWVDLLVYGACSKLMRFLDASRIQTASVENLSRATVVAVGDAGKIANQLYAMYQQRLQEERRRLLELNPPQLHFTR